MTSTGTMFSPQTSAPSGSAGRLLSEAREAFPELDYASLTSAKLRDITLERGVDFATVLLYDRIRRSGVHAEFIEKVEAFEPGPTLPRIGGKMLVAPAAFYREHPRFGGDGRMVRAAAEEFGLAAGLLGTQSTGSVTRNAGIISRELEAEADGSVVLVSLSKGGADVRVALEQSPQAARKVAVWLNICGLVRGTPISQALLGTRWWQRGLLRGYLAYTRADVGLIGELSNAPQSLLGRATRLPAGLKVIHVVAFPLACHLSGNSKARHARMAHLGPNDGSMLLRESILEPGLVYPVWGADHFMRSAGVQTVLRGVLGCLEGAA
jgi:hypothetical protein